MAALSELTGPELDIAVEKLDEDLFRSVKLWKPVNGRGVFGGQVIAQSSWAATKTVEPKYRLHSLHCYFMTFGNADIPILYQVERLRTGRSYATRSVKAIQTGKVIFSLLCSFQVPEPAQPTYQDLIPNHPTSPFDPSPNPTNDVLTSRPPVIPNPTFPFRLSMSDIPAPEDCQPTEADAERILAKDREEQLSMGGKGRLSEKLKEVLERRIAERKASNIEIRYADRPNNGKELEWENGLVGPQRPWQLFWFRTRKPMPKQHAMQKCVIAYLSDFQFIGTVGNALQSTHGSKYPKGRVPFAMSASLDHSMHFYDDEVDASDWLLYYMEAPRAGSGRGVVQGRIYTRGGKLAVVCAQEGAMRAQL